MFSFVSKLIALLILFSVLRTVITYVVKLFAGSIQTASHQPPLAHTSVTQNAGELQKDPVCGTFVPVASSLKRVVSGHAVYFCSAECRDRY